MTPEQGRRRVVMVSTFDPWPVRSGITRRIEALARALDAEVDLTLVILDVPAATTPAPVRGAVVRATRDPSRWRSLVQVLYGAGRLRPITAAFYVRPELRRVIAEVVERVSPDVVVTHGIGGAELVRGLVEPSRIVFDADTIDPDTYRRISKDMPRPAGLQWRVDANLLRGWHGRTLPRYAGVTVVSQEDRNTYGRLAPGARITVVPNGVELPERTSPGNPEGSLLFVGALHYPPNMSAVAWMAEEVLPLVPDQRLLVVGEGEAPAHPQIDLAGFVPDLTPLWRQASMLVVPLRSGGGTRLKVLEAMGHGLPVVSTTLGAEGLGARPDEHYLRAESAGDFALQAARLRDDPDLRLSLSRAGRELAEEFTWQRCTRPLVDLVTG